MIDSFSIFKVTDKKADNLPDYRVSAKVGEEYKDIGGGWIKEGKAGKFISIKLSKPYGTRSGYTIVPTEPEEGAGTPPQASKLPLEGEINASEIDY